MLSQADAELALRDPAIPGLHLLLDVDNFRSKINSAIPSQEITDLTAEYIRYKPHTSCLVSYHAVTTDGQLRIYAKGLRAGASSKLKKANQRINGSGTGGSGAILNDRIVAIYLYPRDQDIEVLPRLNDPESRRELFKKILHNREDLWDAELRSLRYKPERRYVAQMIAPNAETALLKAYAGRDYQSAQRGGKVFVSRGTLKVAQRLGRSSRHRLVILEWLDGQSLAELLMSPDPHLDIMLQVGYSLAELHSRRPRRLQFANPLLEMESLKSTSIDLAFLNPELSERINNLFELLVLRISPALSTICPIHNDFSADQVLINRDNVIFLDLDSATIGDPWMDLSSFVAKTIFDVLLGDISRSVALDAMRTFLDGYSCASERRVPGNFNFLVAADLLRLAPHPFRYRLASWPLPTRKIVERAEIIARRKQPADLDSYF